MESIGHLDTTDFWSVFLISQPCRRKPWKAAATPRAAAMLIPWVRPRKPSWTDRKWRHHQNCLRRSPSWTSRKWWGWTLKENTLWLCQNSYWTWPFKKLWFSNRSFEAGWASKFRVTWNGHLDFRDWSALVSGRKHFRSYIANVHHEPLVIGQPCQMAPADRKPSLESRKVAGRKKDKVAGLRMSAAKMGRWKFANG